MFGYIDGSGQPRQFIQEHHQYESEYKKEHVVDEHPTQRGLKQIAIRRAAVEGAKVSYVERSAQTAQ